MRRKELGNSGYELKIVEDGKCMIKSWTYSYEVVLFLSEEEARQFLNSAKKEWQLDD